MSKAHQEYLHLLESIRWNGKPQCPYCGSTNAAAFKSEQRYHCNDCFTSYSVTVGTLFHQTHVDLQKWFHALKLVMNSSRVISVRRLAQEIGVSKNTASSMIARIRKAMKEESELLQELVRSLD
ncbi:transposase [Leptolyngbya sp. AN03gr2]|uniref:transposase n=1 Tax=unclassified Leptolyngbya TaxID=2650499 RepID=UPI003D311D55